MSPIAQMEGLDYRIHARFGRHLAGARAFHFKSLSICVIGVIGGFNSLFQGKSCSSCQSEVVMFLSGTEAAAQQKAPPAFANGAFQNLLSNRAQYPKSRRPDRASI